MAKEIDIEPLRQRIRCNAHVLNLVAKAILYGTDGDCIVYAAKVASQLSSASCASASLGTMWGTQEPSPCGSCSMAQERGIRLVSQSCISRQRVAATSSLLRVKAAGGLR
jgi:hypothetical protein